MELQDAINKIYEGRCLLFLGAGFSTGAKNLRNEFIPSSGKLSAILDSLSGSESEGDLEEAAEAYIEANGEYQLVPLLKDLFTIKDTSESQDILCSHNWYRIYTTNYDNVVETSALKRGKMMQPITLSEATDKYKNKKDVVIHLNGGVFNLDSISLSSEFKLTSGSYMTQEFQQSDWVTLFRYDLEDADAIFFIGYSLRSDLDLRRIIFENVESLSQKTFFIMSQDEPESIQKKIKRFGQVKPIGLERFSEMVKTQFNSYQPPVQSFNPRYICFEKYELFFDRPNIQDEDIHRLYYKGELSRHLAEYSIKFPSEYPYYIQRESLQGALNSILNGERNILIHSDLGNGKTMFIEGLKIQLTQNGYEVYSFRKYTASQNRELEQICQLKTNKVVIVVENYSQHWDIIDLLAIHRTDQIVIVSERTVVNDMTYEKLVDKLHKKEFKSIDLNIMAPRDVSGFMDIFDRYGLWGELAAQNESYKKAFLEEKSNKSICATLVSLLKSPQILGQFKGLINELQKQEEFYEIVVFLLISKVLAFEVSATLIATALNSDKLASSRFRTNDLVREFLSIDSEGIRLKSSIFARVILSNVISSDIIKKVLVKAFKNMDKHRTFKEYKNALKALLSFTNLRKALITEEYDSYYLEIMADFFQKVRECQFCKNNPHYWLQYAILKLEQSEFEIAGQFFDNAYSYAERVEGFTTYQIDNHYARYLLSNSIKGGDDQFMMTFKKAHAILVNPQYRKDTKFYPFKVAQIYPNFWETYKNKMNSRDKEFFSSACQEILGMIAKFKESMPQYRHRKEVKTAGKELEKLLASIEKP